MNKLKISIFNSKKSSHHQILDMSFYSSPSNQTIERLLNKNNISYIWHVTIHSINLTNNKGRSRVSGSCQWCPCEGRSPASALGRLSFGTFWWENFLITKKLKRNNNVNGELNFFEGGEGTSNSKFWSQLLLGINMKMLCFKFNQNHTTNEEFDFGKTASP